jgi:hypothetical protein
MAPFPVAVPAMRAGVKPLGTVILVLVHVLFSRADLFEAIPKRRVMAEVKAVKVERSRARGHVASNTLTALTGAISWLPLNCFKQKGHKLSLGDWRSLAKTFFQRVRVELEPTHILLSGSQPWAGPT